MINLPPINHVCCKTPCFQEFDDQENYPCWGNILCIYSDYTESEDGDYNEWRIGACEGHAEMYPSYDYAKYNKYIKEIQ
jgi:hypothetical protein